MNSTVKLIRLTNTDYDIWTVKYENENNGKNILCINGGPGFSHDYMLSYAEKLVPCGFTVYFYDQLGTGNSHNELTDEKLWNIDRYVDELNQVINGLNVDNLWICGHSWGVILTIEYALRYDCINPMVMGIILSNMTASIDSYVQSYRKIRDKLISDDLTKLIKCEQDNDFDCEDYKQIMGKLSSYACMVELPVNALKSLMTMNRSVYNTMFGKNEFYPDGNCCGWNRWDDLCKINLPVLVTSGRYDPMMSVEDIEKMSEMIPNSELLICEKSAHLSMIDEPDTYFQKIVEFCC